MELKHAISSPRKTIWLHPDANCNAFEHMVDDPDCACEICKNKPRLVILAVN
jgi:hypothetical protein